MNTKRIVELEKSYKKGLPNQKERMKGACILSHIIFANSNKSGMRLDIGGSFREQYKTIKNPSKFPDLKYRE